MVGGLLEKLGVSFGVVSSLPCFLNPLATPYTMEQEMMEMGPEGSERDTVGGRALIIDRVFQPCDYTEAKIQSIFLHTYNWVCLVLFLF